jgi:hypothetical protein
MPRIELDELTRRVTGYFQQAAEQYGLQPAALEARYILNWGGYVNASFTITDGQLAYHLKLADDEEMLHRLAVWYDLNEILAGQYCAPRILDWIEIPETDFAGLLFQYLPGRPADLAAEPDILQGVLDLLPRLHADQSLAIFLMGDEDLPLPGGPQEGAPSCADYFLGTYIDRFDEDLLEVARALPPFVPLSLLDWMMGETRELEGLARDEPAFQIQAGSATHGDLWPNNILVGEDGQWHIIDWDDLSLGDPAVEYSLLLGRLWQDGHLSRAEVGALLPEDPHLCRRFELCLRAYLLDQVIDSLADWVESDFAPEHQQRVQTEKEHVHKEALALYRQIYGDK